MEELNSARLVMGVHTIIAILMGFFSPSAAVYFRTNWAPAIIGIVLLIVIGYGTEFATGKKSLTGKKGIKFWAANGIIIYLLVWFVSWVYFFNV